MARRRSREAGFWREEASPYAADVRMSLDEDHQARPGPVAVGWDVAAAAVGALGPRRSRILRVDGSACHRCNGA